MANLRVFISAGEPSGDRYAAQLVHTLSARFPEAEFFGCAGPRMRKVGVCPLARAEELAVVGIAEVAGHLPRIWRVYRQLWQQAHRLRPHLVVLVDSPEVHLRLARRLKPLGVPVAYLVAPQVWAWRPWRVRVLRDCVDLLLCIFPFEEQYFRARGVCACYIGHPLATLVRPASNRDQFFREYGLEPGRPLVGLLPGSRLGEALRHLGILAGVVKRIQAELPCQFLLCAPDAEAARHWASAWREPLSAGTIQLVVGKSWDVIAHADVVVAASGTVTIEAALLGTPLVSFYRVSWLTWCLGRPLVKVPYFSMVNLVAGKPVIPELIQRDCTPERIASEAVALLRDSTRRVAMREELGRVACSLRVGADPMELAATMIEGLVKERVGAE